MVAEAHLIPAFLRIARSCKPSMQSKMAKMRTSVQGEALHTSITITGEASQQSQTFAIFEQWTRRFALAPPYPASILKRMDFRSRKR